MLTVPSFLHSCTWMVLSSDPVKNYVLCFDWVAWNSGVSIPPLKTSWKAWRTLRFTMHLYRISISRGSSGNFENSRSLSCVGYVKIWLFGFFLWPNLRSLNFFGGPSLIRNAFNVCLSLMRIENSLMRCWGLWVRNKCFLYQWQAHCRQLSCK